jgi:hypothetical protein
MKKESAHHGGKGKRPQKEGTLLCIQSPRFLWLYAFPGGGFYQCFLVALKKRSARKLELCKLQFLNGETFQFLKVFSF